MNCHKERENYMEQKEFHQLGLSIPVLNSIKCLGYHQPTPIQSQVIPIILEGKDVIGQAQTGTGKTLAYTASILSKVNVNTNYVKAIILTPTRELALQVTDEFQNLNQNSHFDILAVYGGSNIEMQIRTLRKGVDIVVGTPGRVMDLMRRKALRLNHLEFFVLDEADEMLNMGFLEDIQSIFEATNTEKQVLLFSATMPDSILKLARQSMSSNYEYVVIKEESKTSIHVKQYYYLVSDKIRVEAMCRVLDTLNPRLSIIFCQTKKDVDYLLTELVLRNYSAEAMHGDIAQNLRIQTLERFKQGAFSFLIATDVAARGIHVDNIDLVINYNLPQDVESYIHRIGRTGRAFKEGMAISFVTPSEVRFLKQVETVAQCRIEQKPLPSVEEIYQSKKDKIFMDVQHIMQNKQYESCISYVRDKNKDELMRFAASLFHLQLEQTIGSDLTQNLSLPKMRKNRVSKGADRVFITIGRIDDIKGNILLDFIEKTTHIPRKHFRNMEMLPKFTFLDVDSQYLDVFLKKMNNQKWKKRIIRVEKSRS